jgi:hypothetical protein
MLTIELEDIADYVRGIEQDLYQRNGDAASWQVELTKLHRTIEKLMDETAAEENENARVLFAFIEYRARLVRDEIMKRIGVEN